MQKNYTVHYYSYAMNIELICANRIFIYSYSYIPFGALLTFTTRGTCFCNTGIVEVISTNDTIIINIMILSILTSSSITVANFSY